MEYSGVKSAVNIVVEYANVNGVELLCTMIERTPHWLMPVDCLLAKNIRYLYFNRFSELLINKPGREERTLTHHAEMVDLIYLRWVLPLRRYGMIPPHSYYKDIFSCQIDVLPEGFYDRVTEGSIVLRRAQKFGFYRDGVIADEGDNHFPSDVFILATGFRGDQKL